MIVNKKTNQLTVRWYENNKSCSGCDLRFISDIVTYFRNCKRIQKIQRNVVIPRRKIKPGETPQQELTRENSWGTCKWNKSGRAYRHDRIWLYRLPPVYGLLLVWSGQRRPYTVGGETLSVYTYKIEDIITDYTVAAHMNGDTDVYIFINSGYSLSTMQTLFKDIITIGDIRWTDYFPNFFPLSWLQRWRSLYRKAVYRHSVMKSMHTQ